MSRKDNQMRKLSFLGLTKSTNHDGGKNVQLDDEMDKVFSSSFKNDNKFDVVNLSSPDDKLITSQAQNEESYKTFQPNTLSKYNEEDYDLHRKKSYPHVYAPLKAQSSPMKREDSKDKLPSSYPERTGAEDEDDTPNQTPVTTAPTSPVSSESECRPSNVSTITDNVSSLENSATIPGEEGDRSFYEYSSELSSSNTKHVQFNKKKTDQATQFDEPDEERNRRRQHYQKPRKFSLQDNNNSKPRRQTGSESNGSSRKISVQPEDAALEEIDIDDLTSHRSDDPRGMRRHRFQPSGSSFINTNRKDGNNQGTVFLNPLKKTFDHRPHEVFVQLDELSGVGEDREWKETARWIKYEEDVEEGSDRWGKPHVASLSFHSLLNLRRCLETGVVLMDLEEKDLPGVAYRIVEQMVIEDLIHEEEKPAVMRALLLKHRHVNEHSGQSFPFGSRRKFSSYSSLQSLRASEEEHRTQGGNYRRNYSFNVSSHTNTLSPPSVELAAIRRNSTFGQLTNINEDHKKAKPADTNGHGDAKIEIKEETYTSSQEDLKRSNQNDSILKRIPVGAEATTVLVGAVDFLEQPTIAFVRLAEGIAIPGVTEVSIPVRFIFILLGPKDIELDYHEIGRSIATLMSNAHFHDIAYKADDRKDLLSAINEFLDDSIVLPPGKWERQALLPFEELKAKSEMIRSRKNKALQVKKTLKQLTSEEEKKLLAAAEDGPKRPPNPLEKTNRLWGGLINDIKRRLPMFKSDIKDGLNSETLAATIFMYFAALSTAITFGGLSSDKTKNLIGISETLVSTSLVGVVFHLLAGQPLVIIGTTGPLLLFDEALIQFCESNGFAFLTVRVYIGIWLCGIAIVVSAFEGSVYVRLLTRFTQEIFSALITLIYIVETVLKLITVYGRHPLMAEYDYKTESMIQDSLNSTANETIINLDGLNLLTPSDNIGPLNQPNTALFCTILTLGTFTLAYYLKMFRNSHFLGRNARRALGDFGVPISIALFVMLDFMIPEVFTGKLSVPEGVSTTEDGRGWLIPLGPVPMWLPFAAGVPALLVYILIFMETHISELIVDKPERGLKKGSGLHLDIVLLCFLNSVCGLFGMPWHCAATVRSVTHVSAVTIMSRTHAPGDAPHVVDVKEQRISGFFVALMVGLSVTMGPILRMIPMSVLFGVFLYMGIASMMGVQFFERLRLLFMPVKYHPSVPFVRRVPTWKMHLFTIIQILALALLWTVKSSKFSLAFPFFLILMVPIRQKLASFFTIEELRALDGSQPNADAEAEPDFYEVSPIPA